MPTLVINQCVICDKNFEVTYKKRSQQTCGKDCSYSLRIKTRNTQHTPCEKICTTCNNSFIDTSKKKLVTRCTNCIKSGSVQKRKENGSYTRTDAQNEKLSQSLKEKYANGWNPNTEEHRAKLSILMKDRWQSGEMAEMTRISCQEKYGVSHHTHRLEYLKIISKFSYAKHGFRNDIGINVRSSWEANFARYLTFIGKKWEYEPRRLKLNSGKTYLPDFYLPDEDVYYEIKGFWNDRSREKVSDAVKDLKITLVVIEQEQYDNIKREFSHLIPNWEF